MIYRVVRPPFLGLFHQSRVLRRLRQHAKRRVIVPTYFFTYLDPLHEAISPASPLAIDPNSCGDSHPSVTTSFATNNETVCFPDDYFISHHCLLYLAKTKYCTMYTTTVYIKEMRLQTYRLVLPFSGLNFLFNFLTSGFRSIRSLWSEKPCALHTIYVASLNT